MFGLAVNDRGHTLARIFAHPFPNTHHVATSGIDDLATLIFYLLQNRQLRSKRGQNNNVVGLQFGNVGLFVSAGQVFDPERRDLLVHFRVMNDFTNDEETTIFENLASGIGQIDRALDSVAKSKLLGQPHRHIANGNNAAVAAHPINDTAAIM